MMAEQRETIFSGPASYYDPIRITATCTSEGLLILTSTVRPEPLIFKAGETISFVITPMQNPSAPMYANMQPNYGSPTPGLHVGVTWSIQNTFDLKVERLIYTD